MTLIIWTDTVAVRLIKGEQAVGWYAAGNRAALALAMLSGFYMQGAFPVLSRASREGSAQHRFLFQHCYQDMILLFVPSCLWAMAYAREIVLLLFRRVEYLAAVPVFRVFQLVLLAAAVSNLYGIGVLVVLHRDQAYQRVLLLTAAVFIPLCVVCTIYRGILGASVAALLAQSLSLYLFTRKTRNLLCVDHRTSFTAVVAGLGVAAVSKFTGVNLYWSAALLLLTYGALFGNRFWPRQPAQGVW